MSLSIESRIIAMLDSDHTDRIPGILTAHFKNSQESIKWSTIDEFGQPILLRIIETSDAKTLAAVLEHVSEVELQEVSDENKCTSLHFAALNGDEEVVGLVAQKAQKLVDARDSHGCTPLHWAAKHGKTGALPHLIPTSSIDVEDEATGKWTPLHYAASSNKVDACKWLVEHGASKEKKDAHGRTALEIAEEHSFLALTSILK
jgi:ankyrin repeat protein